jgi:GrpB-like predicted nucleotidyltransferase (UPF0157 family)
MTIRVVDYDPQWKAIFQDLQARHQQTLDDAGVAWKAIEHVGSTSVEGLAAKPVIDIDIVVAAQDVEAASAVLQAVGYESLGELGIEDRWAFRAPTDIPSTNTYIVVEGSLALRNHLGVRTVLRNNNPALRDSYASVKRALAESTDDIDSYVTGKSDVLSRILELAGLSDDELLTIRKANSID